jgi:hypothetical protein
MSPRRATLEPRGPRDIDPDERRRKTVLALDFGTKSKKPPTPRSQDDQHNTKHNTGRASAT